MLRPILVKNIPKYIKIKNNIPFLQKPKFNNCSIKCFKINR
uniref:Uncharacterized protein n=1 Tax=Lepeophtheirus salmonis TaxID=72036 RepID=A0A0K2UGM0_LEPSM